MPTASPKATAAATAAPQPEREQVAGGGHGGGAVGAGEVFLAGQGAPRGRGEGRPRPSEESINTSSPRQVWAKSFVTRFSPQCNKLLHGVLHGLRESATRNLSPLPRTAPAPPDGGCAPRTEPNLLSVSPAQLCATPSFFRRTRPALMSTNKK